MLSQIGDLVQVIGQALEVNAEEAFNLPGSRELLYLSGRSSLALPLALASGPIVITKGPDNPLFLSCIRIASCEPKSSSSAMSFPIDFLGGEAHKIA